MVIPGALPMLCGPGAGAHAPSVGWGVVCGEYCRRQGIAQDLAAKI